MRGYSFIRRSDPETLWWPVFYRHMLPVWSGRRMPCHQLGYGGTRHVDSLLRHPSGTEVIGEAGNYRERQQNWRKTCYELIEPFIK